MVRARLALEVKSPEVHSCAEFSRLKVDIYDTFALRYEFKLATNNRKGLSIDILCALSFKSSTKH